MIVYVKLLISDTGGVYFGKILQGQLSGRSIMVTPEICLKLRVHRLAYMFSFYLFIDLF